MTLSTMGLNATLSIMLCSAMHFFTVMLSAVLFYYYAKCRYAECRYAECRGTVDTVVINYQTKHSEEKNCTTGSLFCPYFTFLFPTYVLSLSLSLSRAIGSLSLSLSYLFTLCCSLSVLHSHSLTLYLSLSHLLLSLSLFPALPQFSLLYSLSFFSFLLSLSHTFFSFLLSLSHYLIFLCYTVSLICLFYTLSRSLSGSLALKLFGLAYSLAPLLFYDLALLLKIFSLSQCLIFSFSHFLIFLFSHFQEHMSEFQNPEANEYRDIFSQKQMLLVLFVRNISLSQTQVKRNALRATLVHKQYCGYNYSRKRFYGTEGRWKSVK